MKKWLEQIITFILLTSSGFILIILKSPIIYAASPYEIRETAINITVLILTPGSPGSGTIITRNQDTYYVLTAGHVVDSIRKGEETDIQTHDNKLHQVDTHNIIRFPDVDLAIIKFESRENYETAKIGNSEKVFELATVYVAGFPLSGEAIRQNFFITKGEISSLDTFNDGGYDLVYTNTTRVGMSGGPVLNDNAELIGIHGRAEGTMLEDGTEIKQGFNLGIPIKIFEQAAPRIGFDLKKGLIASNTPVETPKPPPVSKPPVETPKPPPVETPKPPIETPKPPPVSKPQTPETTTSRGVTLIAAKPGNDRDTMYDTLENFLKTQQWEKADQQTWELLKQVGNDGNIEYLTPDNIKNFSCTDLKRLNDLWLKNSNYKFGFSVQSNIWRGLGGNDKADEKLWRSFAIRVGWKKGTENDEGGYIPYNKLDFSLNAPNGHLPALSIGGTPAGIKAMDSLITQICRNTKF